MLERAPRRRRRRPRLMLLALLLSPTVACARAVGHPDAVLTLPLRTFAGRPVVAITIDSHGPYDFILDSGAAVTLVDTSLAKEIGLRVSGTMETGSPLGAPATLEVTQIAKVFVGSLDLGGQKALLFDLARLFPSPDAPRGVLSYLAFGGYLIVHDYPGGEIRLERGSLPESAPNVFPMGDEGSMAEIPLTVGGHEMRVHVDTGSPGAITLPLSVADSLPLVSAPVVRGRAKTVNAEFDVYSATLDGSAEIGAIRIERPELQFIEGATTGNVGNGFLSGYVVTIDPAGRRLRLEEGETRARPMLVLGGGGGQKRYGIRFTSIAGERLDVRGVDPGSPAEKAGLEPGDSVVGMNGRPLAELDQAARIGALRTSPLRLDVLRGGRSWACTMTLE
jgi:predicted aspartyl protease